MAQYRNVKEFTDRIRKAYPKYREEYVSLGNALIEGKKKWNEELRRGWRTPKEQQEASIKHDEEMRKLRLAFESVEDRATAEFEAIKQECIDIFEPYNRATASMIDMPTLELLKSGILKDNELFDLADSFSDNVTMLRIIGKYAEERANISDTADRKMASFAIKCKGASFPYIVPVNDLILWSTRAVRADKDHRDKDQVFAGASGIARLYEETADNITAEAEKYYIKVSD